MKSSVLEMKMAVENPEPHSVLTAFYKIITEPHLEPNSVS